MAVSADTGRKLTRSPRARSPRRRSAVVKNRSPAEASASPSAEGYDYDWPPTVDPEVDQAFVQHQERRWAARSARDIKRGVDRWPKREHLERMRASGRFRFCRETLLHSVEEGDADRVVGFARSLGLPVADQTDEDLERELQVGELEQIARRVLGDRTVPFVFGYRVRIGVR